MRSAIAWMQKHPQRILGCTNVRLSVDAGPTRQFLADRADGIDRCASMHVCVFLRKMFLHRSLMPLNLEGFVTGIIRRLRGIADYSRSCFWFWAGVARQQARRRAESWIALACPSSELFELWAQVFGWNS